MLGVRPVGYRAPNWEMTYRLPGLLARHGFRYDAGLMDSDWPYRLAVSPEAGAPTIVELPGHWALDDWGRYNYLPGLTGSGVITPPSVATPHGPPNDVMGSPLWFTASRPKTNRRSRATGIAE